MSEMTAKKVIILGFGPGFEEYPRDYEGEIWGLNMAAVYCDRLDRLFMADRIEEKTSIRDGFYKIGDKKIPIDLEKYKQIIINRDIPFVSCHPYPEIPKYEAYPLKEIVESFGSDYFANCIAYMIAYAIYKEVKEIEIWGVKQGLLTEYVFHKGSVEFWLGIAVGRNIDIKIVGDSHLLRTSTWELYGYKQKYRNIIKS